MMRTRDTSEQTIVRGDDIQPGRLGSYHRLTTGPGEPHQRRLDLLHGSEAPHSRPPSMTNVRPSHTIAHLVQLTDFQIADVASPTRFEFAERHATDPNFSEFIPAQRPQETLVRPALATLAATIRTLGPSPRTGTAPQLAIATGDVIDNAQANELEWYLALLDGGEVGPLWPGDPEGLYSKDWPGADWFWSPEDRPDRVKTDWGFPTLPGLLAHTGLSSEGMGIPWLACHGNHEALVQGVLPPLVPPVGALNAITTGSSKPWDIPDGLPHEDLLAATLADPSLIFSGPAVAVRPDPARRLLAPGDFAAAHLAAKGAQPPGHGLSEDNARRGDAYYHWDGIDGLRIIVLDTAHPGGAAAGSIGAGQLEWLEDRLKEVSSHFIDPSGRPARHSGSTDAVVLIASHHGPDTLTNLLPCPTGETRYGGAEIVALLHRFPNVIGWISGHVHIHSVVPYPHPTTGGFWSITTASIMDWPSQARELEIVANEDGTISIWSTLVDHAGPVDALDDLDAHSAASLGALHREFASNHMWQIGMDPLRGTLLDRNVEMLVTIPEMA